ncbi:hypothetical protein HY251_19845 [bacterium]|nr:hypothetical protein [bacterium]
MATDFTSDRSFLGRDFLTWLWFRCEVEGGEFELSLEGEKEDSRVALVVEDALSLVSTGEDGSVMTLRKGTPTLRPEAASALASGMTLKKARVFAARGPREWQFTLDGDTLDLGSIKTPEPDEPAPEAGETDASPADEPADDSSEKKKSRKADPEDELEAKLFAAEEARAIVDALYLQFLDVRLAKDWDRVEVPRLRDWVSVKLDRAAQEIGRAPAG